MTRSLEGAKGWNIIPRYRGRSGTAIVLFWCEERNAPGTFIDGILQWGLYGTVYLKRIWSVTECSIFLGKQKTNLERWKFLTKQTNGGSFAFGKNKNECNVAIYLWNKTKGRKALKSAILRSLSPAAAGQKNERSLSNSCKTNMQRCKNQRAACGTPIGSISLFSEKSR